MSSLSTPDAPDVHRGRSRRRRARRSASAASHTAAVKRRERAGAVASAVYRGGRARAAGHLSARAARAAESDRTARSEPAGLLGVLRQSGNERRDRHDAVDPVCECGARVAARRRVGVVTVLQAVSGRADGHAVSRTVRRVSVVSGRVHADLSVRLARLGQHRLATALSSAGAAARFPVRRGRRDSRGSGVLRAVRRASHAGVVRHRSTCG